MFLLTQRLKEKCIKGFYCITELGRGVLPAVMQSFGLHFLAGQPERPFQVLYDKDKKQNQILRLCAKINRREEQQALSIPAQKDKLKEIFGDIEVEFIEDKASAFKPFNRPNFASMLERIRKGEKQDLLRGIQTDCLVMKKDAGEITYMIRTGVIEDLKLATYHFENTPEGIWMLQMALSQSQYESAKKGRDVKRGLMQSIKMGFYPCPAPLGYLDDKFAERGKKMKRPDPERFDIVRKMFDLMLTGEYTVPQILKIVNKGGGSKDRMERN